MLVSFKTRGGIRAMFNTYISMGMKRTIFLYAAAFLTLTLGGCGFDDAPAEYPTKAMLFTYQNYNRELVVGEGLRFRLGIVFAGLERNDRDRKATYEVDSSLVPKGCTLMPSDYYRCSDPSTIVVRKGELKGYMPVIIDSLKFVSDPKSITGEYVIPFRIVSADADVITEGKEYMVLHLKYLAKQFGYYYYSGKTKDSDGVDYTYQSVSTETTSARQLVTVGPTTLRLVADPYGTANDPAKTRGFSMLLDIPTSGGGKVLVSKDPKSTVEVFPDGESSYDVATKTIVLRYKYTVGGKEYSAEDVMRFRNRIRDDQGNGVAINEWEGF